MVDSDNVASPLTHCSHSNLIKDLAASGPAVAFFCRYGRSITVKNVEAATSPPRLLQTAAGLRPRREDSFL